MSYASSVRTMPGDESSRLMDHDPRLVLVYAADVSRTTGAAEPVQLRAEHAAKQTGVQFGEIEWFPFDLSALESEGVFVNVDARNFGLLDRRLDWCALGVTLPRRGDLAFRPPRRSLSPAPLAASEPRLRDLFFDHLTQGAHAEWRHDFGRARCSNPRLWSTLLRTRQTLRQVFHAPRSRTAPEASRPAAPVSSLSANCCLNRARNFRDAPLRTTSRRFISA